MNITSPHLALAYVLADVAFVGRQPRPPRPHHPVPLVRLRPTRIVQTVVRHGVAHAFQMALVDDNLVGPGEVDLLPRLLLGKIRERLAREDEAVAGRESTAVAGRRRSLMENQHG